MNEAKTMTKGILIFLGFAFLVLMVVVWATPEETKVIPNERLPADTRAELLSDCTNEEMPWCLCVLDHFSDTLTAEEIEELVSMEDDNPKYIHILTTAIAVCDNYWVETETL